jgi:hypothetical protein
MNDNMTHENDPELQKPPWFRNFFRIIGHDHISGEPLYEHLGLLLNPDRLEIEPKYCHLADGLRQEYGLYPYGDR